VKLAVTIDTEADGQWDYGRPVTTRNVGFWAPFQELCERHGVVPSYLVTSEIAEDERARDLLCEWSRRGAAEVGAHLHPWTTPPFADLPGLRYNDPQHAYPSQLPESMLREKLHVLTGQVREAFGASPTSFRAGRFGLDARGARILAEEGYLVDSSVTPLWTWRREAGLGGHGGPDFRRHPLRPFRIAGTSSPGLLELPVTILVTYSPLRTVPALLEAYRWLPVRAVRRLLLSRWLLPQPMWLSPDPRYSSADLQWVWRCAEDAGVEAAVMIFHSSELMPGGSPFRPDAQSIRDLLTTLDALFSYARRRGAEFPALTALAGEIAERTTLETRPL
jgi:hypothetical protein